MHPLNIENMNHYFTLSSPVKKLPMKLTSHTEKNVHKSQWRMTLEFYLLDSCPVCTKEYTVNDHL